MDLKSNILILVVTLVIFTSLGMVFYKTIVLHDFEVVNTEESSADIVLQDGVIVE